MLKEVTSNSGERNNYRTEFAPFKEIVITPKRKAGTPSPDMTLTPGT
jgi:hypothetical protein